MISEEMQKSLRVHADSASKELNDLQYYATPITRRTKELYAILRDNLQDILIAIDESDEKKVLKGSKNAVENADALWKYISGGEIYSGNKSIDDAYGFFVDDLYQIQDLLTEKNAGGKALAK